MSYCDGNIAVIFALSLLPILAIGSFTIQHSMMTNSKVRLQSAADMAVLSAANLLNEDATKEHVREVLDANLLVNGIDPDRVDVDTTITQTLNSRTVKTDVVLRIEPLFEGILQTDEELYVAVTSTAQQVSTEVEIALVLDISSSMNGSRLTDLKSASTEFVDLMLDPFLAPTTSISIVPFGGTVNIGDFFDDLITLPQDSITNPSENQYSLGTDIPFNAFRFPTSGDCVEFRGEDFDVDLIPSSSRPQVPDMWKWNRNNPWCPRDSSKVFFNSNDADALKSHLQGMTLSDGTGMDIGALWGLKALSPSYRGLLDGDFPDRPVDFGLEDTTKVMVIMTDGGITAQYRVKDFRDTRSTGGNQQTLLKRGSANHQSSHESGVGQFKKICEDAKANGIVIYTIGFRISSGSLPDQMLQYCASKPSYYHLVETTDLRTAFTNIASSIKALRLTD